VLVTSRNPVWRGLAEPLAVDVLAREQAVTFLARRTGSQDSGSLDALAEVLVNSARMVGQLCCLSDHAAAVIWAAW